jgi:tryptophan-rich sensory protein
MAAIVADAMDALASLILAHVQPVPLPALSDRAALVVALALPLIGGIGLSAATRTEIMGWYRTLNKPSWNPPNAVFGPVWTSLYTAMGYASYLVYASLGPAKAGRHLAVYLVQLCLNFAWTPVFFRAHALGLAAGVIALMWLAIVATIAVFSTALGASKAWMLLGPYLAWVSYASALTAWIWRNNNANGAPAASGRPRRAAAGKRRVA